MSTLHIKLADGTDERITLTKEITTVGRDRQNDVVINDESVSTFHAEIRLEDGVHILRDAGSTNGIRVNGDRVSEAQLNDGDLLRFGSVAGSYVGTKVAAVSSAPAPPAATSAPDKVREVSGNRPTNESIVGTPVAGFGSSKTSDALTSQQKALIGFGSLGILACLAAIVMSIGM
ncbi:FHA domain-containing protein [Sulfuriroseicoccus oceanibius]|uniref:FHA domain-containing protein n=1 Tax=Sulfuriroseicoccus oceanibius TaxID=2707525 RepID=A0A6B3L856_9BACT|nr:FHA domain-containing protein [Sulfuriroseicoccus oceanibius]QQL44378.1 FHA domain-containing protein [Sulfuriroseicoccus oceanibius]